MKRRQKSFQPERVMIQRAMEITGLSLRTMQFLAAQGKIPGASKPAGRWTFDERDLRGWIEQGKPKPMILAGADAPGARSLIGPDLRYLEAYERVIGRGRKR